MTWIREAADLFVTEALTGTGRPTAYITDGFADGDSCNVCGSR